MCLHSLSRLVTACFLLAFGCVLSAQARDGASRSRATVSTDSLLNAYYGQCRARVAAPEAPAMCDTLFLLARAAGDVRMQTVALCVRLDHFYYRNDRENILDGVNRVQEFCRAHPTEDLRYFYYFVWSSRLITYYLKQNQSNTAVYETRRMLAEAEADDYPHGVASCYRMLANLYLTQGAWRLAYDNFRRQIEVLERNGIDDINLPTQYASLAQSALELNMPDSALVALRKAEALPPKTAYQQFTVDKGFGLYYIACGNFAEAKKYVEAAEELFREDPALRFYTPGLRYLQTEYYKAVGNYHKALETVIATQRDTVSRSSGYNNYTLSKDLGDIYWQLRDMERAADSYREYIRLSDSVRNREIRMATDDFSGILEISRLQNETRELQYAIQQKRLRNTYFIIGLLAMMLVLGGLFFARVVKLNRRLKSSEATVVAQNENLLAAGEELRRAKERAEDASRMKSDFIKHMSHEVRTPLNSIVGFSQVLASEFRDSPSTGEYARIIEANSMNLLRLIDDVLDIAYLDQADELARDEFCRMNDCCRECVDKALPLVKPGVTLMFDPSCEDPVVRTNAKRVTQVLMHLLHNAAKFTESGMINLRYDFDASARLLRFTVTDTGPGIPRERQQEVFERFAKLDTFSQGTGLGLPICRIIAAKLGGRLCVDPAYTGGCRMILELPAEFPEAQV